MKKDKKKQQQHLFPEKVERVKMPSGRTFVVHTIQLGCQTAAGIISHE